MELWILLYPSEIGHSGWWMLEVRGQRGENGFTALKIIFSPSLSGYNVKLEEDGSQNRLNESMALFKTIMETKIFDHLSIILFLNKKDIFDKKITSFDLKDTFTDFSGRLKDKDEAKKFILSKFLESRRSIIYSHMTNAVDQNNLRHVFSAVKQTIFKRCIDDILRQGLF